VLYRVPANNNIGLWVGEGIIKRVGNDTTLQWSTTPAFTVNQEALATIPSISHNTLFGIAEGWTVYVTGKAATTIDWVCEVEYIRIPVDGV
jgi:hypothetical protein